MAHETITTNWAPRLISILALLLATGCQPNWHADAPKYLVPYEQGDYAKASDEAGKCAKDGAPADLVLFNMEDGAILRAAGRLSESNIAFSNADTLVGDYNQWPTVRISEELTAALTTARTVNYRGNLSDLVMMNTYRALNAMELGQADLARSMLIRAAFVQQDIAEKYAEELHQAQDENARQKQQNKNQFDANKTLAANEKLTHDQYKDVLNLHAYADFVNPFCDYVQGIYFMGAGLDQSDHERAATAFKRTASMVKTNPYLQQDIDDAERVANGSHLQPLTYVIYETGTAPEMNQIQVPLPLFLVNNQAPTVVLYFPTIKGRDGYCRGLQVTAGGATYQTAVVSDMDAVIMQEFKNNLPTVITRMIIGAATKAAIDAGVKQAVKKESASVQLAVDLISTVYQVEMNQADLRIWRTLPKQLQVARFATPSNHVVTLSSADGTGAFPVQLEDGKVNIVYVKSVHAGVRPVVRQFLLHDNNVIPPVVPAPLAAR